MENNNENAKEFAERINKLHAGKIPIMPIIKTPDLQTIIDMNYEAVVLRGLITPETYFYDFMDKLEEESKELAIEYNLRNVGGKFEDFEAELIDCISVLLNMAKHYKVDVIEGLKANIEKNFERAKNNTNEKEQK